VNAAPDCHVPHNDRAIANSCKMPVNLMSRSGKAYCHVEHTGTHIITKVKQSLPQLVFVWVPAQITCMGVLIVRSESEFRGGIGGFG
jgi:hypothetical protein